ncbi:MAG TPA: hypothetical protein PLO47_00810 [Bacillota bacterium]|nr:hypothetical protein [Bacillota bacterium]
MKNKKSLLIKIAFFAGVVALAVVMFIIGRGHTVYFDNQKLEYEGKAYECPYKIEVEVKGERVAKLYAKERGSVTTIGSGFKMVLKITQEQNGRETVQEISLRLPRNMDGIVLNLPAIIAGLPEEAYLSEFIAAPVEEPEDEEIVTDEFGIGE